MYNKILDYFKSLPEEKHNFIANDYFKDQRCCAIGALLLATGFNYNPRLNGSVINLKIRQPTAVAEIISEYEITLSELHVLQTINDTDTNYKMPTPNERYWKVVRFLEKQVAISV